MKDKLNSPQDSYKWFALATIMLGIFMAIIDANIVNIALPHMMSSFSTNVDRIRWVIESYALAFAIFTLTTSWIREVIGIKKTFILGISVFTFASLLCASAWNVESMIFFRILQAIGGGIMMPTGFTLITESFPPEERGTAFGYFGIVIVFAPTVGPTIGGYLVDNFSWHYIFYINLPFGILTVILSILILREFKALSYKRFDIWGFITLSISLASLLIAMTDGQREGWNSDYIISLFAISVITLIAFIIIDLRVKNPLIDLTIFSNFHFAMISFLNIFRSIGLFGRTFLLPLFLQNVVGYKATTTGLLLIPGALTSGITMPVFGKLTDKYGPKYFIIVGIILITISNFMYHNLEINSSYISILIPMILFGVGMGSLNAPITSTAMNVVKKHQIGMVSTILSVIMQVGGAFSVAILGTILNSRTIFHLSIYSENVNPYSYQTLEVIEKLKFLCAKLGDSIYLQDTKAKAIISMYLNKQSSVAGYQDAFIYTALFCIVAMIPALLLWNVKVPATKGKEKISAGE